MALDLSLEVVTTASTTTSPTGSASFVIDLHDSVSRCQAYPSGVYPVRIQLVDTATGSVLDGITTVLVYTAALSNTVRLRLAAVLPLATALGPTASPTQAALRATPSVALTQPSKSTVSVLDNVIAAIGSHPTVPVTIAASPQTVQALATDGRLSTVTDLARLAALPSTDQFTSAPYTPINASALVGAGLGDELTDQVARGKQVLATDITHTATPGSAPAIAGSSGPWVTNDGLDDDTLAQLQSDGYNQLVIPSSDVTSSPTAGSSGQPLGSTVQPFTINSTHGPSFTAVTSNTDLSSRFTADPGNPVLAANQLLAELAQIYYEYPNDSAVRAVVAVAPTGWTADPTFIDTLLTGLGNSPIAQAVTTAGLFQTYPTPAPCRTTGCRLISSSSGSSGLPATTIQTQRTRINSYTSAITDATTARQLGQQLGDLVLASESELLRPAQQSSVLRNSGKALGAQTSQFVVSGDRTITLTSRNGTVPVIIVSSAPYSVNGTLTLTSDKLLFANGAGQFSEPRPLIGSGHSNVIYVGVKAQASGEFRVNVTFQSPSGGLVLTSGILNVRSTATSVVGIVLSLGAVAVLLMWWIRTTLRRRVRTRGHRHSGPDGPGHSPVDGHSVQT